MANEKVMKVLKVAVPVVAAAASLAGTFLGKKEQEETIAKKVAEALANAKNEEA